MAQHYRERFAATRRAGFRKRNYQFKNKIMLENENINEQQKPDFLVGAVIGSASRDDFKTIGFKEMPHYTVMNSLLYDLGRGRYLTIGCLGTPNEMLFIGQIDNDDNKKVTDVIVLKNYDYDGYTKIEDVKTIITAITGRVF